MAHVTVAASPSTLAECEGRQAAAISRVTR